MSGRNVTIGRDAIGNAIVTGDHNTTSVKAEKIGLPRADSVDIQAEIAALRTAFSALNTDKKGRIETALTEAAEDASASNPNKNRVGGAIERALDYATEAEDFAEKSSKLVSTASNIVGWLGDNWTKLLPVFGVSAG